MRRYSEDIVKKVRNSRLKTRRSYAELSKEFGIPSTTIKNWCVGNAFNDWNSLILSNERRRKKIITSEASVIPHVETLTNSQSKLLAGILYGCEGSKYPSTNSVSFVNSDHRLILAFLKLIRKSYKLNNNKLYVHLQIHSNQSYAKLKQYWSNILNIPKKNFIKPTITIAGGKKHREKYFGTCTLRYRDYKIQLKLIGIYERFVEKLSGISNG